VSPRTVLILGGTAEARELAGRLAGLAELRVVSSLAGRVRDPARPPGQLRIGGFGGPGGLADWLRAHEVAAVVDATHPFAGAISAHAVAACATTGTPLLALARPQWTAGRDDDWHQVDSLPDAAELLPSLGRRAFLTTGRQGLPAFAGIGQVWFLIRCVDPPAGPLPARRQLILARGPYHAAAERALMRRHRIDVLVTKNSGGALTSGKLTAARQLRIPVLMIRRPAEPPRAPGCSSPGDAAAWLLRQLRRSGAA
jgi:precorrin-6A/cobalt-precorrin-6A reductase